jgi:hypothetical protein
MILDARTEPKKYSIRLTLKNSAETDLKLHSYVSSASPSSQLSDMLSRSNRNAPVNLDFELPKDSNHGIWVRYRYLDNAASGFDVHIHVNFSKSQDITVNTDVYYIESQEKEELLSYETTYTMQDTGETIQYQVMAHLVKM